MSIENLNIDPDSDCSSDSERENIEDIRYPTMKKKLLSNMLNQMKQLDSDAINNFLYKLSKKESLNPNNNKFNSVDEDEMLLSRIKRKTQLGENVDHLMKRL